MRLFITVIITLSRKFQCFFSDRRKLIQFTNHVTSHNHRYLIISAAEMDNMRLHQLLQLSKRNKKKSEKNNIANSEEEKYVYLYSGKHIPFIFKFYQFYQIRTLLYNYVNYSALLALLYSHRYLFLKIYKFHVYITIIYLTVYK